MFEVNKKWIEEYKQNNNFFNIKNLLVSKDFFIILTPTGGWVNAIFLDNTNGDNYFGEKPKFSQFITLFEDKAICDDGYRYFCSTEPCYRNEINWGKWEFPFHSGIKRMKIFDLIN